MLAHYGAHLVEKQASGSSRAEEAMILVKSDSGSNVEIKAAGYWAAPLQLPRPIFDDLLKARLIREDPCAGKPAPGSFAMQGFPCPFPVIFGAGRLFLFKCRMSGYLANVREFDR